MIAMQERLRRTLNRVRKEVMMRIVDECRINLNRRSKGVPELSKEEIVSLINQKAQELYDNFCLASGYTDLPDLWADPKADKVLNDFMRGHTDDYNGAPNAKAAGINGPKKTADIRKEALADKKKELDKDLKKTKKMKERLEILLEEDEEFKKALAIIDDRGFDVTLESK